MPFIENSSNRPEWIKKYRSYCVIDTLESMFNQILGHTCIAPEAIYQVRDSQIELPQTIASSNLNLHQRIRQGMSNAQNNIRLLISAWVEADPEMGDYLKVLDLEFVDLSYRKLEELVIRGHAVDITYIKTRPDGQEYTGHMFHLHRHGLSLSPEDVSSQGGVRKNVKNLIRSGEIIRLVDETRQIAGYSGLVIPPWC